MRATRATAIAVAATAMLSACGPVSHLRLDLRAVDVTVPRVVAPALALVPPSAPPAVALPPISPVVPQLPASTPVTVPPESVLCPTAPQLAVPKYTAPTIVDKPPASQFFLQRASGSFQSATGKGTFGGTVSVKVQDLPDKTTSSGQKVKSWQVQQVDPFHKTWAVEGYELLLPSSAPGASPPGVYLVGLAWSDPVRGHLSFQPVGNGIYVLPSPVQVASNDAQEADIATDPNSLTTLQLVRNVRGRKRIDVCGQLVDTWTVEMSGTLTSPGAQWQVTWNQQIATAYGAVDVDELVDMSRVGSGASWTRRLISTTVPKETR
jgi:hypothetical protein